MGLQLMQKHTWEQVSSNALTPAPLVSSPKGMLVYTVMVLEMGESGGGACKGELRYFFLSACLFSLIKAKINN